ncbi:MAG: VWA domain-containing protein [Planctomycetes bacterium]|nr:VWA domain-containing protein [Planctomycetota bacterium]
MGNWFASPTALWLGLLIGPLLLLYMLRHKPVRKRVPSVVLWVGVARAQIATSPFQRLQKSLSLLLMLLSLIALVLALAGFRIPGGEQRGVPVTIIVDVTASMSAYEKGGTRMDLVRERANDVIAAAGNSPFSVFAWDGNMRAITAANVEGSVARASLDELQAAEFGASNSALARALGQMTDGATQRVVLISDHSPGDLAGAWLVPAGTAKMNAGIVTASLSELSASDVDLFFGVDLSGAESNVRVPVVLERSLSDGSSELVDARDITLQPGIRTPVTFSGVKPGLYSLRLKLDDGLELDNVAWLRYSRLPVQDVVITGEAPPALTRAVEAIQDAMGVVRLLPPGATTDRDTAFLFTDAASSGAEPRLPAVYFGPLAAPSGISFGDEIEVPGAATRPTSSSLWRGAGAPDIRVPKVYSIESGRYIKPVLEAGAGTAVATLTRDNDLQDLLIAFPLDENATGFTGKLAFVIFWANWFDYVRRVREPLPRGAVSTRQTVAIAELAGRAEFRYGPADASELEPGSPGRALHFDNTGIYRFEGLNDTDLPLLGVSLLDAGESNLEVAQPLEYDESAMTEWMQNFAGEGERRDLELRPWLALLAAALLLFDWFWFRRRFPMQAEEPPPPPKSQSADRGPTRVVRKNTSRVRA